VDEDIHLVPVPDDYEPVPCGFCGVLVGDVESHMAWHERMERLLTEESGN
jgi:hypothetical protein